MQVRISRILLKSWPSRKWSTVPVSPFHVTTLLLASQAIHTSCTGRFCRPLRHGGARRKPTGGLLSPTRCRIWHVEDIDSKIFLPQWLSALGRPNLVIGSANQFRERKTMELTLFLLFVPPICDETTACQSTYGGVSNKVGNCSDVLTKCGRPWIWKRKWTNLEK